MSACNFKLGELVFAVPPKLDYFFPGQIADISLVPSELQKALSETLAEQPGDVLVHFFGSPTFEWSFAAVEHVARLTSLDEDLALLYVPSSGKNHKASCTCVRASDYTNAHGHMHKF